MGTEASAIDIHAHAVPASFVAEVVRGGIGGVEGRRDGDQYILSFPGEAPLRPIGGVMTDFGSRREWLEAQQVAVQYVAPWLDIHGQQLQPSEGRDWVGLLNDAMADATSSSDGTFRAYATVHLADAAAAAEELARAVRTLGFVGAMIPTDFPTGDLTEPRYDALWEAASDLGVPIVLHPPTLAPSGSAFERYPALRTLARAVDTTIVAAALCTTGVLERFPSLRLVLVHGGGFLPYQVGRLDQSVEGTGVVPPSTYVRRMLYDTTALTPQAVRMLAEYVGPDRVMVGSDYAATTVQPPWPAGRLLENIRLSGLDVDDQQSIMSANAQHYLSTPG